MLKLFGLIVFTSIIIFCTIVTMKKKWAVIVEWTKKTIFGIADFIMNLIKKIFRVD